MHRSGQLPSLERRELVYGCSNGDDCLYPLWLRRTGLPNGYWQRAYHMTKTDDASDKLAALEAQVADIHESVLALSAIVTRILEHLDPSGASRTLHMEAAE